MRRWIVIGVGVVAAALLAAAVTWRLVRHDTASPLSVGQALADYRAEAAAGTTPVPTGVYVYRTTGSESVSALGGARHRYPARTTITVVSAPCGMKLRWDALEERGNTWTVCDDGASSPAWTERHRFFGQDDVSAWACPGAPWLPGDEEGGEYSCDDGSTIQTGRWTLVRREPVDVAGTAVETVHIRIAVDETGGAEGRLVEDRWLEAETGLPVRMSYRVETKNPSIIGDVTFAERYTLRLTSLEPRR